MPILALQPATAPVDAPFPPASAQAMLNFVSAYTQVSGLEQLSGIVLSATTPVATDRDKAWLKLDPASGRAIGFFIFKGDWVAVPIVPGVGDAPPANPQRGEIFFNTALNTLLVYDGSQWTSNLTPSGDTGSRPTDVPVNYLYFDTDISRLLRLTTQGWTTFDGAVGDVKMVDAFDVDDALSKNPGWSEFTSLAGKFPIGASDTYGPTSEGGRSTVPWGAKGTSAAGGSRETPAIGAITIDDKEITSRANLNNTPTALDSGAFEILPPYKAMIFLRKDY
ncbi:MAG: hypothetical protein ACO3EH_00475 [Ilumatobacteraceae bacterium]